MIEVTVCDTMYSPVIGMTRQLLDFTLKRDPSEYNIGFAFGLLNKLKHDSILEKYWISEEDRRRWCGES